MVSDGNNANAIVFNAAFVSRTANSDIVGVMAMNNTSSGGTIANPQQKINDNATAITANTLSITDNAAAITALQSSVSQNNYSALVAPTELNDDTEGYSIGSVWVDTTADKIFMAVDVSTGAAIWKNLGGIMYEIDQTYFNSALAVDDSTWVELIADSGANVIRKIQSFYGAGSAASIGIGAAAAEAELYVLPAGGQDVEVNIPANTRISIRLKAGETALTASTIALNLFKES